METPAPEVDQSPPEEQAEGLGMSPLLLGVLIATAFALGFFGVYAYRSTQRPEPVIVTSTAGQNREQKAQSTHFHPEKPDVSISTAKQGEPEVSDSEQKKIDEAIAEFPRGYDALEARDAVIGLSFKSIPSLTVALNSPDHNVRMNAAMAINQIAAGSDDSPNSEEEIKGLRPYFDRAKTVPELQKLWNDPDQPTRLDACYAMANIGDPSSTSTLIKMANDENVDVRAGVAYGIGKLKALEGIPTLVKLLNDHDLTVRVSAVEGMRPFDTPVVKSALADRLGQETDPDIIDRIKSVLQGEPSPESEADGD
jgi:hypothetical protein